MINEDEIKRCPICGGSAHIVLTQSPDEEHTYTNWAVWCFGCGAVGPDRFSKESAVESWENSSAKELFERKLDTKVREGEITPEEAESEWDFFCNGSDSYQKYYC